MMSGHLRTASTGRRKLPLRHGRRELFTHPSSSTTAFGSFPADRAATTYGPPLTESTGRWRQFQPGGHPEAATHPLSIEAACGSSGDSPRETSCTTRLGRRLMERTGSWSPATRLGGLAPATCLSSSTTASGLWVARATG